MHTGRTALVTGGLSGIGLAVAAELASGGARVGVGARRGDDPVETALAREAVGAHGLVATLDVCDNDSVARFVAGAEAAIGPPDILVNAAGIYLHQAMQNHPDEVWQTTLEVNLSGPFRMIRACLPGMKTRGWGRIVNIASTAARTAAAEYPAYCASKAGLIGLTRAVALDGAPRGVTCVAVSPTWVETEMLRESARRLASVSGRSVTEEIAAMAAGNPQQRLVQPEEIAALVGFCCSAAAAGLSMEDIQVNAASVW